MNRRMQLLERPPPASSTSVLWKWQLGRTLTSGNLLTSITLDPCDVMGKKTGMAKVGEN